MREFAVYRASTHGYDDTKPCDEAFQKELVHVDVRVVSDPEHLPGGARHWYGHGANHRTMPNGHIARDIGQCHVWCVKFSDLDDLMNFITKYRKVVINDDNTFCKDVGTIIIYDDSIE